MSAFSRFAPASRRAYSYFSSRSGGRFFNSAKPPKAAVVAAKPTPTNATTKAEPSGEGKGDNLHDASSQNNAPSTSNPINESTESSPVQNASSKAGSVGTTTPSGSSRAFSYPDTPPSHIPTQMISPKDLRMHQFFSLHRPLLLISQPPSLFRSVPSSHSPFSPPLSEAEIHKYVTHYLSEEPSGLPSEPFVIDADAEVARQLTRALTMSKASATVSWEDTLKSLGLDVSKEADRITLKQQFEQDWEDVLMDSTKRKRRKKMKKHK
jgi:hypothetical protein